MHYYSSNGYECRQRHDSFFSLSFLQGEKWQFLGQLNNSLYCRHIQKTVKHDWKHSQAGQDSAPSGRCWEEDRVKACRSRGRDFDGHLLHSAASPLLLSPQFDLLHCLPTCSSNRWTI